MGFLKDFSAFASKGNVLDLAVGIIVGSAFGKIISSLVSDILMPILGLLISGVNFKDMKMQLNNPPDPAVPPVMLNYGLFLQNVFDFIIVVFAIFLIIRVIVSARAKMEKEKSPELAAPEKPTDIVLLEEIRDLLKK